MLAALEKRDARGAAASPSGPRDRDPGAARCKVRERQVAEAEGNITALELSAGARRRSARRVPRTGPRSAAARSDAGHKTDAHRHRAGDDAAAGCTSGRRSFSLIPDVEGRHGRAVPARQRGREGGRRARHGAAIGRRCAARATASADPRPGRPLLASTPAIERRWEDWKLQERQAPRRSRRSTSRSRPPNIRLDIAEKELENHEAQIENSEEVLDFLQSKFTNRELYNWMVSAAVAVTSSRSTSWPSTSRRRPSEPGSSSSVPRTRSSSSAIGTACSRGCWRARS